MASLIGDDIGDLEVLLFWALFIVYLLAYSMNLALRFVVEAEFVYSI